MAKGRELLKTVENKTVYSATDLCDHLECLHLTSLKVRDLTEDLPKDAPDDQSQIIMARGIAHEQRFLDHLRSSGKTIANLKDLPKDDDLRAQATMDAIRSGVDVIYQAYLRDEPFAGYADFLIKSTTPSKLGNFLRSRRHQTGASCQTALHHPAQPLHRDSRQGSGSRTKTDRMPFSATIAASRICRRISITITAN